jgi:transcriptional regulator of acetoin/glycerol metabolism
MARDHAKRRVEALTGKPVADALLDALREHQGNVSAVARLFGVDRVTVYDWMKAYGIERRAVFTAA